MIGQFNKFNFEKQSRDYRDDFYGIEVCHMDTIDELKQTLEYVKQENINVGFHFPVLNNQWKFRDPQYLSLNPEVKNESLAYMTSEFERAMPFKPVYILTHYPKPVVLDETVDWTNWRFADRSEFYFENEYSEKKFVFESKVFFKWLSEQGYEKGFKPILELDALNSYIYNTDLLPELLTDFKNIRLCLDIGRVHLQDRIDKNFNGPDFVERLAPFTDLVHLWNVKVDTNFKNGHYPALRSLDYKEGWANVALYMHILKKHNSEFKVLFEHKSHLINDEQLQDCYDWITELLAE